MSDILNTVKHTLKLEIQAISDLLQNNVDEISKVIQLIQNTKGRVIISGVGKSAIVAQKFSATLNSTGTRAIYMHGADAVHGDLGMLHSDDLLIYISKSGNSTELELLVPAIRMIKIKLIGIVSQKDSFLYKNADFNLYIPIEEEADPNNLAPTVSTIAQMAAGDAIAMGLMVANSFTPHDFALYHPGGNLGKQMYSNVENIFDATRVPRADPNDNLRDIIFIITESRQGACPILKDGELVGIITDGDIRRAFSKFDSVMDLQASDIMSPHAKTIQKTEKAYVAFQLMKDKKISQLIVMDGPIYCGIIHLHDLIKEGFN